MAYCMYTPAASRRGCTCNTYNARGRECPTRERGPVPAIMPGPSSSNGYITSKYLIRPSNTSDALVRSRNTSRPQSTRSFSLNEIPNRRARDNEDDTDEDEHVVLVKTLSSNDRDGANVQIFNIAGSKLAKDLSRFLNINALRNKDSNAKGTKEERYPRGEYSSLSGVYGLTTAMRLSSSLSHLREILQIYRDYDYCSRSALPQPQAPPHFALTAQPSRHIPS